MANEQWDVQRVVFRIKQADAPFAVFLAPSGALKILNTEKSHWAEIQHNDKKMQRLVGVYDHEARPDWIADDLAYFAAAHG